MTIEYSVAENLYSHTKHNTCCIPHVYQYSVTQQKDDSRVQRLTDIPSMAKW